MLTPDLTWGCERGNLQKGLVVLRGGKANQNDWYSGLLKCETSSVYMNLINNILQVIGFFLLFKTSLPFSQTHIRYIERMTVI